MTAILLVSHFHWDREWYRAFEEFRSRLVDAVDLVLDLVRDDPGFVFMLDGQSIVLEDYVAVRPQRRRELKAGLKAGRLAAGPWYVQPDSFLPSGETHVRNLLHGRTVAEQFGPVSKVAYVPDSFGHPAQFPQLFKGFGLDPFVYWRGNGSEIDELGTFYAWRAPDGSGVRAWHLGEGYFSAGGLDADDDVAETAARVQDVVKRLDTVDGRPVLLMNGFDHLPPDVTTAAVADAVGAQRVLLDDARTYLGPLRSYREFRGELAGARIANLLPGVWSSRMHLKVRNRRVETLLGAWAEPWVALARAFGHVDESASLTHAWRTLLCNQAHDSIGGCSIDPVHERMDARYDDAEGLACATVTRTLEHLAGRPLNRNTPWRDTQTIAVFNASPHPITDVVRIPLEGFPPWRVSVTRFDMHPLELPSFTGVTVNGAPARLVPSDDPNRVQFVPGAGGFDVEFIAHDVPGFGCRRYLLEPAGPSPDLIDHGRECHGVAVARDGSLSWDGFEGLFGIEDAVDRGDSYDCDPDEPRDLDVDVSVERIRHTSGIERIRVTRGIDGVGRLVVEATPIGPVVRCVVTLDNEATDHRLRLQFPTGTPVRDFRAATTFDAATRSTTPLDDTGWVHAATRTFPHQGWIEANGLVVGAPGLPEAEVTPDGDILVTLVRSVGMLSRLELRTRPMPAGPEMTAPGAQELGPLRATVTLARTTHDARDAEIGLWGVIGADERAMAPATPMLTLEAERCELSAFKPAEKGDGVIVRVLNPSDAAEDVALHFGLDIDGTHAVRLDESPVKQSIDVDERSVRLRVPPHALRSIQTFLR